MLLRQLTYKRIRESGRGDNLIQSIICPELNQHRLNFSTKLGMIQGKTPITSKLDVTK